MTTARTSVVLAHRNSFGRLVSIKPWSQGPHLLDEGIDRYFRTGRSRWRLHVDRGHIGSRFGSQSAKKHRGSLTYGSEFRPVRAAPTTSTDTLASINTFVQYTLPRRSALMATERHGIVVTFGPSGPYLHVNELGAFVNAMRRMLGPLSSGIRIRGTGRTRRGVGFPATAPMR
jgi:hypothetical protein